jgi:hypothetical protein
MTMLGARLGYSEEQMKPEDAHRALGIAPNIAKPSVAEPPLDDRLDERGARAGSDQRRD